MKKENETCSLKENPLFKDLNFFLISIGFNIAFYLKNNRFFKLFKAFFFSSFIKKIIDRLGLKECLFFCTKFVLM